MNGERKRSFEELYRRAIARGKAAGLGDEAEDFAGWITLKWLEGKAQHQTLDQSLVGYRRRQHGDPRIPSGRARIAAKARTIPITPDEGREGEAWITEDRLGHELGELPDDRGLDVDPEDFLSGRNLLIWTFVAREELKLSEIGDMMGITESRVSQLMTRAKLEVLRFEGLRQMRERIEDGRSRLDVEWITL